MKKLFVLILLLISEVIPCFSQEAEQDKSKFPSLRGLYFGQKPPGKIPERFMPEFFNAEHGYHSTVIFSENMKEAIWSPQTLEGGALYTKMNDGIWTTPEKVIFGPISDVDACTFSPDGDKIYFTSFYTPPNSDIYRERIWFVNRTEEGWSEPNLIDEVIRVHPTHWTFSFAKNGNLYFTSEIEGAKGGQAIYLSRYDGEKYTEPEELGNAINTEGREFAPFIASNESYLLFTRHSDSTKKADIYISFKDENNNWLNAVDMGTLINTESNEVSSSVSPDGKYLFFLSQNNGKWPKIYWMDASIIDELKEISHKKK